MPSSSSARSWDACDVTAGSRVTFASGMAVHEAGKNLIKEMAARVGDERSDMMIGSSP